MKFLSDVVFETIYYNLIYEMMKYLSGFLQQKLKDLI